MQRWAGRPIWLRSAEASVGRWSPPFCGIRTSVVCWLSNQSVGSPVPRQKKRAGVCGGGGGMPYRGRPAWVQGWALSGGGLCQKDVIMTALAPLESQKKRAGVCVCVCVCVCQGFFCWRVLLWQKRQKMLWV